MKYFNYINLGLSILFQNSVKLITCYNLKNKCLTMAGDVTKWDVPLSMNYVQSTKSFPTSRLYDSSIF